MAEIAIACLTEKITEAVAAAAFRRLDSLMKPWGKVRGKMVQIGRELEVMNDFLRCTSAYRGDHEQPLSTWAKQIQDVASEIEDIIDEYNYIVAGRSWGGLAAYIYNAFNDIHKARALCDVINNLEVTEASLADLWRMRSMYGIKIPQKTTTNGPSDERELSRRLAELAHFMEEDELVGFDGHKDALTLIKWLVSGDPRRGTTSILGMGGVGKTTLVTSVYKDQTITDHFSCRAWVSVSQNYTTEEVLGKILRELHQERMEEELPQHELDSMEYRRQVETLRSYLHHKRYLVVLDDVWHADLWNDISYTLLDNRCGSRIVITTRNQEVSSAATNGCVVRVDPLPEQTAWILFCMKAFRGEEGTVCPQELECWARRMVDT
ncbi:disease resistance protein [Musa troglodytarum]|uniref:Disease resistance protein n=1 Tax=Musa troglodytarum TaxID=320322 RepID=A0A9E7FYQ4_9LILI|nr:disease resistance protein [Musa troglodytarum]